MVVPIFICGHSGRSNLLTEDNAKHWRGKAADDLLWVRNAWKTVQWTVFSGERAAAPEGISSAAFSKNRKRAPRWGVAPMFFADQGFDSPMLHQVSRSVLLWQTRSRCYSVPGGTVSPVRFCMICHSAGTVPNLPGVQRISFSIVFTSIAARLISPRFTMRPSSCSAISVFCGEANKFITYSSL